MTKNLGQYPALNEIGRARQANFIRGPWFSRVRCICGGLFCGRRGCSQPFMDYYEFYMEDPVGVEYIYAKWYKTSQHVWTKNPTVHFRIKTNKKL